MPVHDPFTKQPSSSLGRQTLMIDADDTLWENNIYFEQAIEAFVSLVDHRELSRQEVRDAFNHLESGRVKTHGYGTEAFHESLLEAYQSLTGNACDDLSTAGLMQCSDIVRKSALNLLRGVEETLAVLASRHTVILVTKGAETEQKLKLERSGLAAHFHHVEVLAEKNSEAYHQLQQRYGCDTAHTWMIGNSPRSDINPALEAGMHAVYLPHHSTWVLEREELSQPQEGRRLLHLESFPELLRHFG